MEAPRFSKVDSEFRSLLAGIEADNRVVSITAGRREHELRNVLTNMHVSGTKLPTSLFVCQQQFLSSEMD